MARANLSGAIYEGEPAGVLLLETSDQRMIKELLLEGRVVQQGQYALLQRLSARIEDPAMVSFTVEHTSAIRR